jgi:hypothetical protein
MSTELGEAIDGVLLVAAPNWKPGIGSGPGIGDPTGRAPIEYRCGSGRDVLPAAPPYIDRGDGDGLWCILCNDEILDARESIDSRLISDSEEPY